jgi:hypothetical protein
LLVVGAQLVKAWQRRKGAPQPEKPPTAVLPAATGEPAALIGQPAEPVAAGARRRQRVRGFDCRPLRPACPRWPPGCRNSNARARRAGPARLKSALIKAFAAAPPSSTAVRRYRGEPSPLVRSGDGSWRSGRLDAVLRGDFDLLGADEPPP